MVGKQKLSIDAELDKLQRESFSYFLHEASHKNGLILDKTSVRWPANYEYLYSGSLFTHQLFHIWVDFPGVQDAFMRKCPYINDGLKRARFTEGYLSQDIS